MDRSRSCFSAVCVLHALVCVEAKVQPKHGILGFLHVRGGDTQPTGFWWAQLRQQLRWKAL